VEKYRFVAAEMDENDEATLLQVIRDLRTQFGVGRTGSLGRRPELGFIGDELSPYVQQRAQATHPPSELPEDWEPVAITGTIERGVLSVSAEVWVPAKDFLRYYRALQDMVFDGRRNRPLKPSTLELFAWVSQRRQSGSREVWDVTRRAWNRGHLRHYSETSNFHRDYHRAKRLVEEVRKRTRELDFRSEPVNADGTLLGIN
jgi:hypothetical protein